MLGSGGKDRSKGELFKVSKLSVLLSLLSVGALAILLAAIGWTSPSIQDRLIKRMALERLHSGDNSALLTDNSLHILLCGTGSPMPDPTRANACTAVMAGGHIVIIDAGPNSWSRHVAAKLPAGKINTVLLTHQTGRASCRERVCQYVYIPGVAG